MRLGLALPHYDTSYANEPVAWHHVVEVARRAVAAGFDSIWVSDHLFLDWSKYGGPHDAQGSLECWTTLAALAASTSRVRLGTLALCNDFRPPALLAKMAASLDRLSGGRLDLGLGAGWYDAEYRAAGLAFDAPATRISRMGEAASLIARLLEGEEVYAHGRYYTIEGAVCRPGPAQHPRPPIWIGGKGDLLIRTAARVADGWNFSWLGSVSTYRERLASMEQACERVGRDPATLRRSVGAYLTVGRDEAAARRRFELTERRSPRGVMTVGTAGAGISWDEFRRDRIAGSVAEAVDRLGALAELGVEEVVVTLGVLPFQLVDDEEIELVGAEVASRLR